MSQLFDLTRTITNSISKEDNLDKILAGTLEHLCDFFNAELGSIFLYDEKIKLFVLKAAFGTHKHLINNASYAKGEGLTGKIGEDNILCFRTNKSMVNHENWKGKYDLEIFGERNKIQQKNYLGIPIKMNEAIQGVITLTNMNSSMKHPEKYFTSDDINLVKVIAVFLSYVIDQNQSSSIFINKYKLLAESTVKIEYATTVKEACNTVMTLLNDAGYNEALLSLLDRDKEFISGFLANGVRMKKIVDITHRPYDSNDILAKVLQEVNDVFILDSKLNPNCDQDAVGIAQTRAQYILPLFVGAERFGTLQVDFNHAQSISEEEKLLLKAFAGHLSLSISRITNLNQLVELSDTVMTSSRFIVAEAFSAMVVHSLKHHLKDITTRIKQDLEKNEIKGRDFLLNQLRNWEASFMNLGQSVEEALKFVDDMAENKLAKKSKITVSKAIQEAIDMWINLLKSKNCIVSQTNSAKYESISINEAVIREILSVCIVNSVQAHSKRIKFSVSNLESFNLDSTTTLDDVVVIDIQDDGSGIHIEDTETVFAATYTTKPSKFGTGLGLFIARRLSRHNSGKIFVQDRRNQWGGATFRIVFPAEIY